MNDIAASQLAVLDDRLATYAAGSAIAVLDKGSLTMNRHDFAGWKIGTAETVYRRRIVS